MKKNNEYLTGYKYSVQKKNEKKGETSNSSIIKQY